MSGYLTREQYEQLVWPINPNRVGTDGKGHSHVEAYDIRAHLTRIFGFARWSEEVTDQQVIFEQETQPEKPTDKPKWTVAYRSIVRLTVCAHDGTVLATYTEGAAGSATNQPSRADAHDLALKTSESQAFKRAAANLGDAFGLGLYRKGGSTKSLIGQTLIVPEGVPKQAGGAVDEHITDTPPEEGSPAEQATENRERSTKPEPADSKPNGRAEVLRGQALTVTDDPKLDRGVALKQLAQISATAASQKLIRVTVADRNGEVTTLGALLDDCVKARANGAEVPS